MAIDHDDDYGAFVSLMESMLELDTIFCLSPHLQTGRLPHATPPSLPSPVTAVAVSSDPPSHVPKQEQSCSNCKLWHLHGICHMDGTYFQPGGGMEGCHAEYMANKGHVHTMFVEYLEHAFSIPDEALPPDLPSPSSPTSPILPP